MRSAYPHMPNAHAPATSQRVSPPGLVQPRLFTNVVVYPTQKLLQPPFLLFQGGPDWPGFWAQLKARHCRYAIPVPLDLRPRPRSAPTRLEEIGVWCGPITAHFGHAIADFGGRLAWSSQLPDHVPLVFSARDSAEAPPGFLLHILSRFGVAPERVRLVVEPTRFNRLLVFPQAERLFGGRPGPSYLDLLDRLAGPEPAADGTRLFVSRAGLPSGRIAGESYLEQVLEVAGFVPFRPECFGLDEQLARYRRAAHLVFSEGSAIHALQLLGRIRARVSVIVRRPGWRIASRLIAPRVSSLDYVECLRGVVHGVRSDGRPQPSAGMSILDETHCVSAFGKAGINLTPGWQQEQFVESRDKDLRAWIDHRHARPTHPKEGAAIRSSLRLAGLRLGPGPV